MRYYRKCDIRKEGETIYLSPELMDCQSLVLRLKPFDVFHVRVSSRDASDFTTGIHFRNRSSVSIPTVFMKARMGNELLQCPFEF